MPRGNGSARLDPEKILTAALIVADREGLSGMTLRMVGTELGADPTAIYRHFSNKDALLTAIADRLFGEVMAQEFPTDWKARLGALMRAARNVYRAHPALIDVLANQPEESDNLLAINEVGVGCLTQAGLEPDQIGLFHLVGTTLVLGSGIVDAAWDTSISDRDATRRAYSALDPVKFPAATAAASSLFPDGDDAFELALEMLFDSIERAATRGDRTNQSTRSTPQSTRNTRKKA